MEKRVKLLFNDSFNQCLHCHSKYSYAVDGESNKDVCDILELVRKESDRVKTFDLMQSKFPMTLVAITDFNDMRAYYGEPAQQIMERLHKNRLTAGELEEFYGVNREERLRMEYLERFKIITGAEISAKLGDIDVHGLALDFDERIFGLFRYTKERYRLNKGGRAKALTAGMAVRLSKGKFVLAHPSGYVQDGKISLNDILEAAYKSKAFDGIECATSNTTIEECFQTLRFCAEHDMPVTIGTDFRCKGRKTVDGVRGQREDLFFVESLGMSTGDFLLRVVGKTVDQLDKIEKELIEKRNMKIAR